MLEGYERELLDNQQYSHYMTYVSPRK